MLNIDDKWLPFKCRKLHMGAKWKFCTPFLCFPVTTTYLKTRNQFKMISHSKKIPNTPLRHKSSQSFENSITLCLPLYCLRFICHLWMCICAPCRLRYLWHSHESEFRCVTPFPLPFSPLSTPLLAPFHPPPPGPAAPTAQTTKSTFPLHFPPVVILCIYD